MSPLKLWALASVALFFKMIAMAMTQGTYRVRHKAFVRPEDVAAFGKGAAARTEELPVVTRAQNALRNDGENIPIFLFVSLAYVLLECWPSGTPYYLGAFVLARCVHSMLMLKPRQPWRTLTYAVGLIVTCVMCAHIVWTCFAG